jgi:peptide/nickel transport system substrate-binding protein
MPKIGRRTCVRVVAVLAVFMLFASACSSDDNSQPSSTSEGGGSEAVNRDGTLHLGYGLNQSGNFSLDPTLMSSGSSMDPLWYMLYGRLMRKLSDGSFTPDLAESATVVNPNLIEVKVRPNQTWSDGSVFDANSVKAGLDRNIASKNVGNFNSGFFLGDPTVDVVDPLTVHINLPAGNAPSWYDSYITGVGTSIVKPDFNAANPVGAGPMKIASYAPGTSLTLERNEGYWNADEVKFKNIDMVSVEQQEPASELAALQSGQADIVTLNTDQLAALSGDLKKVALSDPNRMMRFVTCKRDAPLDNVDLRKAISMAMDRQAISDAIFAGTAEPAVQVWPEGNRFYNTDIGDELGFNPEGARQAVQDSGLTNPEFDLYMIGSFSVPDVGAVVQQQLDEVGIKANLKLTNNFVAEFLEPKLPGATFIPQTPAPGPLRLQTVTGTGLGNLCGYSNPQLNDLISQLSKVSQESEEAKDIWWQIDEILAEDVPMSPVLFIALTGGYNDSKLVLDQLYPDGAWVVPDIYTSYMAN